MLPGHAAVDSKVEWIGKADDDIYEEYNVTHQTIVEEFDNAKINKGC